MSRLTIERYFVVGLVNVRIKKDGCRSKRRKGVCYATRTLSCTTTTALARRVSSTHYYYIHPLCVATGVAREIRELAAPHSIIPSVRLATPAGFHAFSRGPYLSRFFTYSRNSQLAIRVLTQP